METGHSHHIAIIGNRQVGRVLSESNTAGRTAKLIGTLDESDVKCIDDVSHEVHGTD